MIKNTQFISLLEILSRILRHPMLKDVDMEQVIQYCIDFISIFNFPEMFLTKEATIEINNYRGLLPCDLIYINLVKDSCKDIYFRSMTSTFLPDNYDDTYTDCTNFNKDYTFKVLNHIIFTSIKNGKIIISYKAIPIDEDGFPMILDNAVYLKTLELYVKKEIFGIKFDEGKISDKVLQHTELLYAWSAGLLTSEFNIPSESEMESISNMFTELVQHTTHFDSGFKYLGNKNYLRKH